MNAKVEGLAGAIENWFGAESDERPRAAADELLRLAEQALASEESGPEQVQLWRTWLDRTGAPDFLCALDGAEARERWAEVCFAAIRRADYGLDQLLEDRVRTQGEHPLFEELQRDDSSRWTYAQVQRRVRGYAAALLAEVGPEPRVAIYLQNSVQGACADLACLLHDIFVTPLSVHLDVDELAFILERLQINVAITDNSERARRLLEAGNRIGRPLEVLMTRDSRSVERCEVQHFVEMATRRTPAEVESILAARPRLGLDDPCTIMFTSGSTGRPKGVVFTRFHLLSKRFARAAALPEVGRDEVLLSYLPLYHTFGRYLEMLGTIYWRGTYVFSGSPSAETLLEALPRVRPTGMIGIPLRWSQMAERCEAAAGEADAETSAEEVFRSVVGPRLRWGLSAAGYLSPRVFRFFRRNGVALCSGFGMTEATGGITMNPPDEYVDNTVGVALPGMRLRFTEEGEMQIGGAYVGRYLREEGQGFELEAPLVVDGEEWLPTGDLFERLDLDHLSIVDRIKDIYKNSRGQTVAPRRVEARFLGVPGIKRTFLVGDHRAYNVLLIVPDFEDPVLRSTYDEESRQEYFNQIAAAANQNLASFERVVNFVLLERDFEIERGELTPKGSFRRSAVEKNFAKTIEALYASPEIELRVGEIRVRIPRWFFRDLGILEDSVSVAEGRLVDRRRGIELTLARDPDGRRISVGSLEYLVTGNFIDLGSFARQPALWMGNPELMAFAPCKAGWDVSLGPVSPDVLLPRERRPLPADFPIEPFGIDDPQLAVVNHEIQVTLFAEPERALETLRSLTEMLARADYGIAQVIRSRITALARHPEKRLRHEAYQNVLLDEPRPDGGSGFYSFIESGLSFLDEEGIEMLAAERFGPRRLGALRRRLLVHRRHFPWPAEGVARSQFESILILLARFVRHHQAHFNTVRQELATWAMHREDPYLAARARELLVELDRRQMPAREEQGSDLGADAGTIDLVLFDHDVAQRTREELVHLFCDTSFLELSVRQAFETPFTLDEVGGGGIWVSRQRGGGGSLLHRVSVNTIAGRHFDLLVTLFRQVNTAVAQETILWTLMVSGNPAGQRVMPRFGCLRPDRAAVSMEFIDGLTLGERIRYLANVRSQEADHHVTRRWRRLFVRGLATFFRAWQASGERIIPGLLNPRNLVIPEKDFHEEAMILSLSGWEPYTTPVSLFRPLLDCFFVRTKAHYPLLADVLDETWIFDACFEGLGDEEGGQMLQRLLEEAPTADPPFDSGWLEALGERCAVLAEEPYIPLPLDNAVERYRRWREGNPGATPAARGELMSQLNSLYRLGRFGEIARYQLYRHTYFEEFGSEVTDVFDRLIAALRRGDRPATQLVELSDLQGALRDADDREVFGRLVFPHAHQLGELDFMTFGESDRQRVTVRTVIQDSRGERYAVREPVNAEETGMLYRLFFLENLPKAIGEQDRHLIVTDATESIVAGLSYKMQRREVVHMDGVVVKSTLTRRGLAGALLEDFVARISSIDVRVLKTNFIFSTFLGRCGFRVDRRWGGLVRMLAPTETEPAGVETGTQSER